MFIEYYTNSLVYDAFDILPKKLDQSPDVTVGADIQMPKFDPTGKHRLATCFWVSFAFFFIYFMIHVLLNWAEPDGTAAIAGVTNLADGQEAASPLSKVANSAGQATEPNETNDFFHWLNAKHLAGPLSISLCSSLLIFSFSNFLSKGMENISVSAPFAFLKAFFIFVFGLIAIQIAGHAEIFHYSNYFDSQNSFVKISVIFLSAITLPTAFFTLYLLERYQADIYDAVSNQIPKSEMSHHPNPRALAFLTWASILFSFAKIGFEAYGIVMLAELAISGFAVYLTFNPHLIPHETPIKEAEG